MQTANKFDISCKIVLISKISVFNKRFQNLRFQNTYLLFNRFQIFFISLLFWFVLVLFSLCWSSFICHVDAEWFKIVKIYLLVIQSPTTKKLIFLIQGHSFYPLLRSFKFVKTVELWLSRMSIYHNSDRFTFRVQ